MKIMHVSLGLPPLRTGGLTKYSVDLMRTQQQMSHEVCLLYPGHYTLGGRLRIQKNDSYHGIEVYEIVNPLPVSLLGGIKHPEPFMQQGEHEPYEQLLQRVKPDVIHLHTLMGIHRSFLEAAKRLGMTIVFTSHDYFGICPKVNLFNSEGRPCDSYQQGQACIHCNQHGYSARMIRIMQSRMYRRLKDSSVLKPLRQKFKQRARYSPKDVSGKVQPVVSDLTLASRYVELRRYYMEMFSLVDRFHFNSSVSQQEYAKYGMTNGDTIPIRHRNMKDQRRRKSLDEDKPLRLTYMGPIDFYKGFYLLKESLDLLERTNSKSWHLHIYGDTPSSMEGYRTDRYTFHGRYDYNDLEDIFNNTDLLIIPSIWKETFGFIGMEALSHAVPVLVSDQVGFKDLIHDGLTGFIVPPEACPFAACLGEILNNPRILRELNQNMIDIPIDFSMEGHTRELMQWYSTVREEVRV
ncbi:glycosyltransferase [Paenibacillus faecalis]|uniref:glycosyltransferase n=1 Tax=Paenibacillus faecalis TaxID=2079532 RepID=UPI000D0E9FC6|nr:glycosyltransferase [Paenibacillus faecalis]